MTATTPALGHRQAPAIVCRIDGRRAQRRRWIEQERRVSIALRRHRDRHRVNGEEVNDEVEGREAPTGGLFPGGMFRTSLAALPGPKGW